VSETTERFMRSFVRHGEAHFQIVVRGAEGAIEFCFRVSADPGMNPFSDTSPYFPSGVEIHRRVTAADANRATCPLLNGDPCYHDGSSLYASEVLMPAFLSGGSDLCFDILERRYLDEFRQTEKSA